MRLSEALKGVARNAIQALLIAGNSCKEIINTRFGNSQIILEKIMHEIRDLPSLLKPDLDRLADYVLIKAENKYSSRNYFL